MNRLAWIGLFFVFALAFILRVMFLPEKALTFGYDQARDAIISQQILKGDLKIQGPPASQPGLYHGVLYYYVLAPGYLIGNGSPIIAAYWIALLNALTVGIVFLLTYYFSKKKVTPALIAAFLFAISFEATQYATWLSNPTIAVWTVPAMYLGLWMWLKEKKRWGVVVAALGFGFSVQAEIFLLYHAVPLAIWLWVKRKEIKFNDLVLFAVVSLFAVSTMIVNEVKFGFRSISGFSGLALGQEQSLAYAKSVGDYLLLYLNQIGRIFSFNSYPGNIGIGGAFVIILALIGLFKSKKSKEDDPMNWQMFLATWLFSHITVVSVGGVSTPFLMVGIGPAVSILLAMYLYSWWQTDYSWAAILVILILIFGNLTMILKQNKHGSTLFSIQSDMLISKQLKAVDYTYQKANKQPFSVNSLTSPLWINVVWTYLYKWHGESNYGYLPSWLGHGQEGILDSLPKKVDDAKAHFLIIEPLGGIPPRYLDETIGEDDSRSTLIDEQYFGEIRVQQRELFETK